MRQRRRVHRESGLIHLQIVKLDFSLPSLVVRGINSGCFIARIFGRRHVQNESEKVA